MKAKIGLLAILALVTLLLPAALVAQEPPPIPLFFQGMVSIDGEPAPVGTIISAEIEGVEVAGPEGITEAGRYGILIEADDNIGKTVVFKVNGIVAGQHEYVDPWETPTVELDLSIAGPVSTYTHGLTISSTEGGSVTNPGEGTFTYDDDEVVSLEATQDAGYRFDGWTGDVETVADVNDPATTITMDADKSVTANFEDTSVVHYALTISSTEGGSVTTPGEGTFTYQDGETVDLVAEADAGYRFDGWTGDVDTVADVNDPTTTITIDADKTIAAAFTEIPTSGGLSTAWIIAIIAVIAVAIVVAFATRARRRQG